MNLRPSSRCASATNNVPRAVSSDEQPQLHPSRLKFSAMISQYFTAVAQLSVAVLISCAQPVVAQKAPAAKPFERFGGCTLEPDEWTDGDSFRVRLPDGRLETFRLYFVDTTESRSRGERSDKQAAYFDLTREEAIQLGNEAKQFTARALSKPFTIQTRWRAVFGGPRFYAFVFTSDGDDLAELLVRNGLARIYGPRSPTPHGRDSRAYRARLKQLEAAAKAAGVGGWRRPFEAKQQ